VNDPEPRHNVNDFGGGRVAAPGKGDYVYTGARHGDPEVSQIDVHAACVALSRLLQGAAV
jgi:hypothetical protein